MTTNWGAKLKALEANPPKPALETGGDPEKEKEKKTKLGAKFGGDSPAHPTVNPQGVPQPDASFLELIRKRMQLMGR
tara:strand:- start:142 stop:372 length:231 start_codon:yes stop_codon:yes gene_type:complete